jgi:FMN phosphatase YigB (HAD superfamily)
VARVDVVTFDYWDTLVIAPRDLHARRVHTWSEVSGLAAAESEQAVSALERIYQQRWEADDSITVEQAVRAVTDDLGLRVSASQRERLVAGTVDVGDVELSPNIAWTLDVLQAGGVALGIICDVRYTPSTVLRAHLDRLGVLDRFSHTTFSDEVGHYKPSSEVFDHAARGLGAVDRARAAHVGDLRRTDVAGARSYGVLAIRYCGVNDDRSPLPDGDHVIDDHADLPGLLGVVP